MLQLTFLQTLGVLKKRKSNKYYAKIVRYEYDNNMIIYRVLLPFILFVDKANKEISLPDM